MAMAKIYKGDFAKDHLPITLVIGGIGAVLVIMPLIVFYMWINNAASEGLQIADAWFNIAFFIALFLIGSAMCFYLVWRGTREHVTVEDGKITYYTTFFTRTIPVLDIEKIMIFDQERPILIYNVSEYLRRLRLPAWKSHDYIGSLVADLKPMNPNIEIVDLRKSADVEVRYEAAGPQAAPEAAPVPAQEAGPVAAKQEDNK